VSPDGRWIGFWADGKLKKIAADGGAPVVLCDAGDLLGASWGEEDTIIAALGTPGQLSRVPATGGTPRVAIDLSAESIVVRWPQLLPEAKAVLYTALSGAGADRANIEVQSADGDHRKVLVRGGDVRPLSPRRVPDLRQPGGSVCAADGFVDSLGLRHADPIA
jgi:serine/threonine-protein kinase